ncbi:unnamed protein product [Sphagnum jensenii]|uniref:Uncharacterized protein n=1 Tax=Sphagnum jensenii TaxID=128206 RepID=A0ABP1B600_9BRYO
MGRIRGNKSRVSGNNGREKLQKEVRHRRHKERQKAARSSLLDRIRDFLTADSFMYGPLLTQPPKFPSLSTGSPPAPLSHGGDHGHGETTGGAATAAGEATAATADEQDKDVTEAGRTSAVQSGDEETSKVYQGSRSTTTTTFLSVEHTVKIPAAEVASTTTTAELQQLKRVAQAHMRELEDEPFLLFGEHEEGTSSMTGSHDYKEDCIPLDHAIAQKVAKMLVCKVGGRYSKELGINLDVGDVEVERWFLAVTLFHRHLTFDVLKQTFKKLGDAGIASVADSLKLEESEVADILESSGYTTYKHRAAARLRKLAMQLEVDYKGKVSSMKTMLDASELSRQISSLHGLNSHTASLFLRELRGVWPGISLSYDRRTTRAAAHLGLLDPDADDASNKFTRGLQNSLKPIAHATGKDERDLEVSLVKLGLSHERHYRDCPGGVACNFLASDV